MLEPNLFAFMERTADAAFAVTREGEICSWDHAAERLFWIFVRGCAEPDLP